MRDSWRSKARLVNELSHDPRPSYNPVPPDPRLGWRFPSKSELSDAVGYAAINITAASPTELDKALVIKLSPLAASGIYTAGARIISAATLPIIALMLSALPRLSRQGKDKPAMLTIYCIGFSISLSPTALC